MQANKNLENKDDKKPSRNRVKGKEALIRAGISLELFQGIIDTRNELGGGIITRVGKSGPRYNLASFPKLSWMHLKSSNWGPMKGFIPYQRELHRLQPDGTVTALNLKDEHWSVFLSWNKWSQQGRHITNAVVPIQQQISLQEILEGLNKLPPIYEPILMLGTQIPDINERYLCVRPTQGNGPEKNNIVFVFDMMHKTTDAKYAPDQQETSSPGPRWWKKQWGDYAKAMDLSFPVYVLNLEQEQSKLVPLKILGVPTDTEGEILPITTDVDALAILQPTSLVNVAVKLPESSYRQVFNTFSPEGRQQLLEVLIDLFGTYNKNLSKIAESKHESYNVKHIVDEVIGRMGIITPFEAIVMCLYNERLIKMVPHINYIFQHGAEDRSPFRGLVDINGPMLHIYSSKLDDVTVTENEDDLIEFLLTSENYMKENYFDVHPTWQMEKWAAIIHQQIVLKQPVPVEIICNYDIYLEKLILLLEQSGIENLEKLAQSHYLLNNVNSLEKLKNERQFIKLFLASPTAVNVSQIGSFSPKPTDKIGYIDLSADSKNFQLSDDNIKALGQLAKQNDWEWDPKTKEIKISPTETIQLTNNRIYSSSKSETAIKSMRLIAKSLGFAESDALWWSRWIDYKKRATRVMSNLSLSNPGDSSPGLARSQSTSGSAQGPKIDSLNSGSGSGSSKRKI